MTDFDTIVLALAIAYAVIGALLLLLLVYARLPWPAKAAGRLEDVPLDLYDAALVCVPDEPKILLLEYLLRHGKHGSGAHNEAGHDDARQCHDPAPRL